MRAIAILAVMLMHYGWVLSGWIGVQIFFVLSGFLITSILRSDLAAPFPEYLKRFYWRRSLRIFPLYFGYLLLFAAIYLASGWPDEFGAQAPHLFTYLYNFHFLAGQPRDVQFNHFWSLSVEEQFYLIWPTVVFLLPARGFKRLVILLILVGPIIRGLSVALLGSVTVDPEVLQRAPYHFTWCQFDAFATGAAVVLFRERLAGIGVGVLALCIAGAVLLGEMNTWVLTGAFRLNTTMGYPAFMWAGAQYTWGYTAINLCSAALLLAALRPGAVSTVLSWQPFVHIGKVSYGVYVFHILAQRGVRAVVGPRHGLENLARFGLQLLFLVGIATLSYRLFEMPFLRLKDRGFGRSRRVAAEPKDSTEPMRPEPAAAAED